MKELKIYKPFRPFQITQHWGNANPMYAKQFNNPNFKLHNGVDARVPNNPKYPVWCPVENFVVHLVRNFPTGGGNEIWLRSKEKVKMFDIECYAYLCMVHADKILVPEGYEPRLGELLMIADNTGFSTGTHTHIGLYRIGYDAHSRVITWIDNNDANGSFSPELFLQDEFAVDFIKNDPITMGKSVLRYLNYLTS